MFRRRGLPATMAALPAMLTAALPSGTSSWRPCVRLSLTQGGNDFIEAQLIAENDISAVPFVSG